MKKIINGKVYDTEKARELGLWTNTWDHRSWTYVCETLYVKRTGEYFIYGKGGPQTQYAQAAGDNQWSGGERIMPISAAEARRWAEEHLDADEYERAFGLPDDDAEPVTLCIDLPAPLMAKIRAAAADEGISITEYVKRAFQN